MFYVPFPFWTIVPGNRSRRLEVAVLFTEEAEALVEENMPLANGLASIGWGAPWFFKPVVKIMAREMLAGKSLSQALETLPYIFPRFYANMIRAGERSGTLLAALGRLKEELHRRFRFRRALSLVIFYPAIVLSLAFYFLSWIMIYVIPKFEEILRDFEAPPSPLLEFYISFMRFLRFRVPFLISALTVIILICITLHLLKRRIRPLDFALDWLKLCVPVLRRYWLSRDWARFARLLAGLLEAQYTTPEALALTGGSMELAPLRRRIEKAQVSVVAGEALPIALAHIAKTPQIILSALEGAPDRLAQALIGAAEALDGRVEMIVVILPRGIFVFLLATAGFIIGGLGVGIFSALLEIIRVSGI